MHSRSRAGRTGHRAVTTDHPRSDRREPAWEHFVHGADVGIRGRGRTQAEAFAAAATALTAVVTDPGAVRPAETVDVDCAAGDPELLLVEWLDALIYAMAVRRMLFSRFEVEIADGALHARAAGEPLDRARHQPAVEVKGATLTALRVAREGDGWVAQCVVDV